MSTPTRPESVPEAATVIYPGQQFGPGVGVQAATIKSIEAQNAHLNANTMLRYESALSDWQYNAEWAKSAHQRIPPPPPPPQIITTTVVYATQDGTVVPPPAGADGTHYAWVWETYE